MLSHVLLPQGYALNLGIKEYMGGGYLKESLIGRFGEQEERITPGPRAYDDRYTELMLEWMSLKVRIQSATDGDDLVLLVTPLEFQCKPATLVVEAGILWNREELARRDGDVLVFEGPGGAVRAYGTAEGVFEPNVAAQGPYLAMTLDRPLGVSTGKARTVAEIEAIIGARKAEREAYIAGFGELADTYAPVMTCLAWDTIYDPLKDRVISPVSRSWSIGWGGYVLFDWDTYFAALLAAIDNKELAYANAIEITREASFRGFVPNFAAASGCTSHDRSQPPVGALVVLELYRRFGDRWLLEELFDALLTWNRWWVDHRMVDGLLCWGSDPYEQITGNYWEYTGVGERFGAALESGLDNSPMYDDIPFDSERHLLMLQDVGLSAMYVMDCRALAEIADVLARGDVAAELRGRADDVAAKMAILWDDAAGIYKNRRTDTGELSPRLSPTNFYPMLGDVPTQAQTERMMAEHFYNPEEFWGEWILPSIMRNDPGYPDNSYWRGRIWAPMNFLVYMGMRRYDLPRATADLVAKSRALLLKEWREHGHVHENYNGDSGEGCDRGNSDRFYHWGGLLGLIAFLDAGYFDGK